MISVLGIRVFRGIKIAPALAGLLVLSFGLAARAAAPWLIGLLLISCPAFSQSYTVTHFAGTNGGAGSVDGPRATARFNNAYRIAAGSDGSLYVAEYTNNTIRKITPGGEVVTLAGLARTPGAVNGVGSRARFNGPRGVAVDAAGNVYVTEYSNYAVRKITPSGVVSVLAGNLTVPGTADGTGAGAFFTALAGIAVDDVGNIFVAEPNWHRIRKITPAGVVTTFAGQSGTAGSLNGTGTAARFNQPEGMAIDGANNLYVTDFGSHTIRKITPSGVVTTPAGLPGASGYVDGTGNTARFSNPIGVGSDSAGTLYVVEFNNWGVRQVTPGGVVTTIAGTSQSGYVDGTGNVARFDGARGACVNPVDGNVYVAESVNHDIRRVTPAGVVTTFAGLPAEHSGADGTLAQARFNSPQGLTRAPDGTLYIANGQGNTVRKIAPDNTVSTVAGLEGAIGSTNGNGASARFSEPSGVVVDTLGNLFVTEYFGTDVRKITPSGDVTTFAGLGGASGSNDGTGTAARFRQPTGLAIDNLNNLFIADTFNHTIRKVSPAGVVTTLAGLAGTAGSTNGTGAAARFNQPSGVVFDGNGLLYVAESAGNRIRIVNTVSGLVSTLAGSGSALSVDGTGAGASFNRPNDVGLDIGGNLLVTESSGHVLRRVTPAGVVTTLAGKPATSGAEDGTGSFARFNIPSGVLAAPDGTIYVADWVNNAIRILTPALSDNAVIDAAYGPPGIYRQLDAQPATAASYSWDMIRRPGGSTAQFSDPLIRNPIFTPDNEDLYQFRLTATAGAAQSITTVSLDAGCKPVLLTAPGPVALCAGQTLTLAASVSAAPAATVQWYNGVAPVTGATLATLSIPGAQSGDTGDYSATFSNACGFATTPSVSVRVDAAAPAPIDNTLVVDNPGPVRIRWADGADALSYNVYADGAPDGVFTLLLGTSASGATGYSDATGGGSAFYLVSAANVCGESAK